MLMIVVRDENFQNCYLCVGRDGQVTEFDTSFLACSMRLGILVMTKSSIASA